MTWAQGPSRKREIASGTLPMLGNNHSSRDICAASRWRCSACCRASIARWRSCLSAWSFSAHLACSCCSTCSKSSALSMVAVASGPAMCMSDRMKLWKPGASGLLKAWLRSVMSCSRRRAACSLWLKKRGSDSASCISAGSSARMNCCTGHSSRVSRAMLSTISATTSMLKAWPRPCTCARCTAVGWPSAAGAAGGRGVPRRSIIWPTWFISCSASNAAGTVIAKSVAGGSMCGKPCAGSSNSRANRSANDSSLSLAGACVSAGAAASLNSPSSRRRRRSSVSSGSPALVDATYKSLSAAKPGDTPASAGAT